MKQTEDDIKKHIDSVRGFINQIQRELDKRALLHDASKLEEPELSLYNEWKPKISAIEQEFGYGSPQYEEALVELKEVLRYHFAANRHHPEHFEEGVSGMNLVDLVEMFCDWKAASQVYGTVLNLDAQKKRFGVSDQLHEIFKNTIRDFGW